MGTGSLSQVRFDNLFDLYLAIALVVGGLVLGWLFHNLVRYRNRPGDERPFDAPIAGTVTPARGHVISAWVMALAIACILFGLAFSTFHAVAEIETPPDDPGAIHYNVTGFQFGWKVNYTGEGGVPFQKVQEWTIPVDTPIVTNVTSQDVWHNFAVPDYRVRVDAIPGQINHLWFQATTTGDEHPVCVMLCGVGHALMHATMHVVPKDDYAKYVHAESLAAYQKLARNHAATFVNGTAGAGNLTLASAKAPTGKPIVLNLTNDGPSAVTVTVRDATGATLQSVDVATGQAGRLYLPALAKQTLSVAAGSAQANLEVSG